MLKQQIEALVFIASFIVSGSDQGNAHFEQNDFGRLVGFIATVPLEPTFSRMIVSHS